MPLLTIIVVIAVVGLLLWLVERYVPMDVVVRRILVGVVVFALVLWLLQQFGLLAPLKQIRIGGAWAPAGRAIAERRAA